MIVSEIRDDRADIRAIRAAIKAAVIARLGLTVDEIVLVRSGTLAKTSSGKRRHRHFAEIYSTGGLVGHIVE